jgi:hypothetical protein
MTPGVPLPDLLKKFISWISLINFDFSVLLSAGCLVQFGFYTRLLLATLLPLGVLALLAAAHALAKRRRGAQGVMGRVYHLFEDRGPLFALAFTFLIFSMSSTAIFQVSSLVGWHSSP